MHFLLHIGEPLFHCVQGRRFVGVRGSHDCRVTFLEKADEISNKILTTEEKKFFVLTNNPLQGICGRARQRRPNIHKNPINIWGFFSSNKPYLLREKFVVIHCRKARNPNDFPFRMIQYLWNTRSLSPSRSMIRYIRTLGPISSSDSPVRATSASIFALISPEPPIDSGPKRRMMAPAPAAMKAIIGTERPLTALVNCN